VVFPCKYTVSWEGVPFRQSLYGGDTPTGRDRDHGRSLGRVVCVD